VRPYLITINEGDIMANFKSEDFTFTIEGGLATLTFTRPKKCNALHPRMIAPMEQCFRQVQRNPEVRCVLIRGEGKHFAAGADFDGFDPSISDLEREALTERVIHDHNIMIRAMQRLDAPVIASVQGGVAGASVGFIGACDLVIAADTSFFWVAHVLTGNSNDAFISYFGPRHIGLRKALEMALLGDRISGTEAQRLGLVNFVVPEAKLKEETDKLVARLLVGPTKAYGEIKRLYYASLGNSLMEQGMMEAESSAAIETSEDAKDGLRAWFEHRKPVFVGR
jgi:2-(1,2-epoxy-1,2-dihydrophenyl)acetyl-CoA isomerase